MHLGIIMDGNRRWTKEKGLPSLEGHHRGAEKVKEVLRWCKRREIKILTLYAFSTENWSRSKIEVNYLMRLFNSFLTKGLEDLNKEGIKFLIIGRREKLSNGLQKTIEKTESLTENNREMTLILAISYGGKTEIIDAIKRMVQDKVPSQEIDENRVGGYLYTAGLPDPDLIIRTSGEQRTSGFLLWQSAYSELCFCGNHWPDFSEEDLDEALADYAKRQRRFGK